MHSSEYSPPLLASEHLAVELLRSKASAEEPLKEEEEVLHIHLLYTQHFPAGPVKPVPPGN